jgi:DNA repair protein RecO
MFDTEAIILRTINYDENSLILHCLSPDKGNLNLLAKGARRLSKKQFPQIGLFRILSITAKEAKNSNLNYLNKHDLLTVNDHLASTPALLDFSAAIAQFSLKCSYEGIPCPLYYHILIECLGNIDKTDIPESAWICRLIVSFLMEQGLFPDMQLSPQQSNTLNSLIHKDYSLMERLDFKEFQWNSLRQWIIKTAIFAGIEFPPAPHFQAC